LQAVARIGRLGPLVTVSLLSLKRHLARRFHRLLTEPPDRDNNRATPPTPPSTCPAWH